LLKNIKKVINYILLKYKELSAMQEI